MKTTLCAFFFVRLGRLGAENGAQFILTATPDETGHASIPTITTLGPCTAGPVSSNGQGNYDATDHDHKKHMHLYYDGQVGETIEYAAPRQGGFTGQGTRFLPSRWE